MPVRAGWRQAGGRLEAGWRQAGELSCSLGAVVQPGSCRAVVVQLGSCCAGCLTGGRLEAGWRQAGWLAVTAWSWKQAAGWRQAGGRRQAGGWRQADREILGIRVREIALLPQSAHFR